MLYHGDCLEEMNKIPDGSVDLVLTDPPYGTTACKWDSVIPFEPMWNHLRRVIKLNGAIVLTGIQPFTSALIMSNPSMFKYAWVWEKERASNFFAAKYQPLNNEEDIIVFSMGGVNSGSKNPVTYHPQGVHEIDKKQKNSMSVGGMMGDAHKIAMVKGGEYTQKFTNYPYKRIKFNRDAHAIHPTQKPVALLEYLIRTYTNEGDTVLDFTMGSGSTGVACVNTNRKFIGIELDSNYYNVAYNRIKEAQHIVV